MSVPEVSSHELDFTPSAWSKRKEVIAVHVKLTSEASKRAHDAIPASLANSYGPSKEEYVDVFGTDLPDTSPIFVYYSGGYWQELNGSMSAYPAGPLYAAGVRTAVIGYDRAPGSKSSFNIKVMINL